MNMLKRNILLFIMLIIIIVPPLLFLIIDLTTEYKNNLLSIALSIGRLGFILLFFQYVLSSRIKIIESGIGLDRQLNLHRITGIAGFSAIMIHGILIFLHTLIYVGSLSLDLTKILGILTAVILTITVLTALFYKKLKMKYEKWYIIHIANYIILPAGFIHSFILSFWLRNEPILMVLWIIMASVYIFVILYRLIRLADVRKHPYNIIDVKKETHDTYTLKFEGKKINHNPGQFMLLNLKRNGNISEKHPFTISSSPTWDNHTVSIKSIGDFTSTIKNTHIGDKAFIDAPYGIFSYLNFDNERELVFIVGGIGITPFMSMLRYMFDKGINRKVTLLWGNKSENDIVFRKELDEINDKLDNLKIIHIMSEQDSWSGEKGFINKDIITKYVKNIEDKEFLICGPPKMMDIVTDTLIRMGVKNKFIHKEEFRF